MFIQDTIEISKPPAHVWKTLVEERKFYHTRITDVAGSSYVLHQEFQTPLGVAKCSFLMFDQPFKRMDFLLLDSNGVKDLKGHWNLIPMKNKTQLQLNIEKLDIKFPVPRGILKKVFLSISHKRLERIKHNAELE